MVKHVNSAEFKEILAKEETVVVDFWATWCGPCKMLAPIFESLASEYEGKVTFLKVDVDDNEELCREYGISSIPNVLLFKNGELKDNSLGFVPKGTLKAFIDENL